MLVKDGKTLFGGGEERFFFVSSIGISWSRQFPDKIAI
jgi:hypothetical protein